MACASVFASAQAAEEPPHPAGEAAAAAPAAPGTGAAAPAAQPGMGMGGQGMMGMMPGMGGQGMMNMMSGMGGQGMMNMMMGGGDDATGMGTIDRVEGRIAFLRTELNITDAQTGPRNMFAAALRNNARQLGAARSAMMAQMRSGQPQSMAQRLEAQERWLAARLEGTRALRTAFTGLYAALSDEQKRTADQLLAPHMGMMRMMMPAMPGGQMAPGATQ